MPWNLARVWMLHRRAGFGANWQQLQRDVNDGPGQSIARLLASDSGQQSANEFEATSQLLLKKAIQSGQVSRLSAWWIWRMYLGPNAFIERCTLMWHNHFATSNRTIQNLSRMYRQNQIFRQHGTGKFDVLLEKAIKDPAMLVWLNANDNQPGHPNENLGRELLELFSLGVGNYTEQDVKEAARALAGWTANMRPQSLSDPFSDSYEDKLIIRSSWKDHFDKTILGKTGIWDGDDLLKIVLEHPATAKRLAWRICDDLCGENVVSNEASMELAAGLRDNGLDLRWAFETVLSSELFYSQTNLKSQIAAPETFVLGCLNALNTAKCPASTLALSGVLTSLGRSLFEPPNVGGWEGGRMWLNARTLVARSNFVNAVVHNGLNRKALPPDFNEIVESFEEKTDLQSIVTQLSELLLGLDRNAENDHALIVATTREVAKQPDDRRWAFASHLLLNSGSAQLC